MNAGNASGYTKEQIAGMVDPSSIPTTTSPRTKQNFLSGDNRYLSYPIARNNQEITGDTLRIKCLEYVPSNGCLLYTSPSPRDPSISRMPSSA